MKPHLPVSLFKMLLVAYAVVCLTSEASRLSSNVSFITYTDFGQNLGRYKTDATANALLLYLREKEGGVILHPRLLHAGLHGSQGPHCDRYVTGV